MNNDSIKMSDLLFHYHSLLQEVHRMWNYLAVIALAAITVVWQTTVPNYGSLVVIMSFGAYAAVNYRLVKRLQMELIDVSDFIKEQIKQSTDSVETQTPCVSKAFAMKTTSVVKIKRAHIAVSILVLVVLVFGICGKN